MPSDEINELTQKIIGCAIAVHRRLGPGFLESVYKAALAYEMTRAGLNFEGEKQMPVAYDDTILKVGFRCDFLVESKIIVECKAEKEVLPIHLAQTLNYLKAGNLQVGLLINFNTLVLRVGIRRLLNKYYKEQ
jgi:GxxExxY protein